MIFNLNNWIKEKEKPMIDGMIPIENSSNIESYFYERQTNCLFIQFKSGHVYSYDAVPQDILSAFLGAPSKGLFLAKYIKPTYKCTKFTAQKPVNPEAVKN